MAIPGQPGCDHYNFDFRNFSGYTPEANVKPGADLASKLREAISVIFGNQVSRWVHTLREVKCAAL